MSTEKWEPDPTKVSYWDECCDKKPAPGVIVRSNPQPKFDKETDQMKWNCRNAYDKKQCYQDKVSDIMVRQAQRPGWFDYTPDQLEDDGTLPYRPK